MNKSTNFYDKLYNFKQNIKAYVMIILIIITLLFFSLYWLVYIRNLQNRECSFFNTFYSKNNFNIEHLVGFEPTLWNLRFAGACLRPLDHRCIIF